MTHPQTNKYHLLAVLLLFLIPDVLQAQYSIGARISGMQANERFGESLNTADITGNGYQDLIIGAPDSRVENQANAGRIYLFEGPFSGDTTATDNQVILQGTKADAFLGRSVTLGDFNGNGTIDMAVVKRQFTQDGRRAVGIFYGPFSPDTPRTFADADGVIITPDWGLSVRAVPGLHTGSSKHGIMIGIRDDDSRAGYGGAVYLFRDVSAIDQIPIEQADIKFLGQYTGGFFGTGIGAEDINGNGHTDFIIGATGSYNGNGITYVFLGPLTDGDYNDDDAQTKILGRIPNSGSTRWGSRIHTFGDANNNGYNDFSITADLDNNGRLAFFPGRSVWPDTLRIQSIPDNTHRHTLFSPSGNNSGTGFAADFSGDYNISGSINPVLGAPRGGSGAISVYNLNGSLQRNITINSLTTDARLGHAIVNIGASLPKNLDFEVDDFAVSAPAGIVPFNSLTNPGVIFIYGGVVTEPNTNVTAQPSLNREIGDSIRVRTTYTEGSRPIVEELLVIRKIKEGDILSIDSLYIEPFSGGEAIYEYAYYDDFRVNFRYEVTDDLGQRSLTTLNVDYAMIPLDFDLSTDFGDNILSIQGSRTQQVSFAHTASADTNGRNINYQLAFTLDPNGFEENNYTVMQSSATLNKSVTYNALNEFVRQEYNEGIEGVLFWTIIATNGVNSVQAANGPGELHFVREGLDPEFNLEGGDRRLVIEGFPDDSFSFSWTPLQADNENIFATYSLLISDDADDFSDPLLRLQSHDSGTETNVSISYDALYNFLEDENLLNQAISDTAYLYYTVEAIIDSRPEDNWFPINGPHKVNIKYVNIVRERDTSADKEEIPESFTLRPNYPNPFNPVTNISFGIPESAQVQLEVFSILGQKVYQWNSGVLSAGYHIHPVDGRGWSSGTYIYRLRAGDEIKTSKMLLIK